MSQDDKKVSNGLSRSFEKFIAQKGGYYSDGLYLLNQSSEQIQISPTVEENIGSQIKWVVLAKNHYYETSKTYPISNLRELKQAIKHDDDIAPFDGLRFHKIKKQDDNKHLVTFWIVPQAVIESLPDSVWIILPETFLLERSLSEQTDIQAISYKTIQSELFLAKNGDAIVSGVRSQRVPSLEAFVVMASGAEFAPSQLDINTTKQSFEQALARNIRKLNLLDLQAFIVKRQKENKQFPIKNLGILAAVLGVSYLALSSAWLVSQNYLLEQATNESRADVNDALKNKKQLDKLVQLNEELLTPYETHKQTWKVWPILLDVAATQARILRIDYKNEFFDVRFAAFSGVKATSILTQISDHENVSSASFSQPVVNRRGTEQFTIRLYLNEEQSKS